MSQSVVLPDTLIEVGDGVFYLRPGRAWVGPDELAFLKCAAPRAAKRRARICLHESPLAPLQQMVIALCRDTQLPIHRHRQRTECFIAVEGRAELRLYDATGRLESCECLDPKHPMGMRMARVTAGAFHTLVPLDDLILYVESANGPFCPEDVEMAGPAFGGPRDL